MYKVSFFSNILNVKESTTIEITKFCELVRTGITHKNLIEKIKETTDKEQKLKLKNKLPAITTSGIFTNGRKKENLNTHSGLICLDIDNLDFVSIEKTRNQIEKDIYTFVVFTSPSGTGLKVFVKISHEESNHLESFLQLENYYFDKYKIELDKSCKDLTRLCFLSFDKNIFINNESKIFEISKPPSNAIEHNTKQVSKTPQNLKPINKQNFVSTDKETEVLRIIEIIKNKNIDITNGYNDWLKLCFAFVDFFGEAGRGYFHDISQIYTGYNQEQTNKQFDKCLKANTGQTKIETFFYCAKQNGNIDIKPTTKMENKEQEKTQDKQPTEATETAQQKHIKKTYVRVGINYFKQITNKDKYGIDNYFLERWSKQTIIDDYANKQNQHPFNYVPKYDSFVNKPDNINYQKIHFNCYNLYQQITHEIKEGTFEKTKSFLKHIFQDKYEVGLDYITLLYQKPTQMLPILCFVSEERKTGKSTFLKYLRNLFQSNCTILSNENFATNFNGHFATKLIIGIDETFIGKDKQEQTERIKKMATDEKTILELKGVDSKEIDFYGKLIMCSNNETNFVFIDEAENRYFINKVPTLKNENPYLLDEMVKEIPAFLHFISTRKTTYNKETRHFFNDTLISTEALKKVKNQSYTDKEREIIDTILECFDCSENKELHYTPKQLHEFIKNTNKKIERIDIEKFLKQKMKLKKEKMKRFDFFDLIKFQTDEFYKFCDKTTGTPYRLEFDKFNELR